jgi:hypothetical protein
MNFSTVFMRGEGFGISGMPRLESRLQVE